MSSQSHKELLENLNQKNWNKLPFTEEEFEDLPTCCYKCKKPIDVFEGYYVVAEWEYACSIGCVEKMLEPEEFAQGQKEWAENEDSDIYYWTDWR